MSQPNHSVPAREAIANVLRSGIGADAVRSSLRDARFVVPMVARGKMALMRNDAQETLLPAFTDVQTFAAWPGSEALEAAEVLGQTLFCLALESGCDALVVDPAGPDRVEFGRPDMTAVCGRND